MENPLDVSANAQESAASGLAALRGQVAALERARTTPASIRAASLAALKAQLPVSAPNNTIVIGRLEGGSERCYLYVFDSGSSKWYRSGAMVEA